MKKLLLSALVGLAMFSCKPSENKELNKLFEDYYEERLSYFPLEATSQGDYRFNDQLPIDISEEYRRNLLNFYQTYNDRLDKFDPNELNDDEKIYYNALKFNLTTEAEALNYPTHLQPFN